MKSSWVVWTLCGLTLSASGSSAQEHGLRVRATILGADFEAIQTAIPELTKRRLDFRKYEIRLIVDNRELVVIFSDPSMPPGALGGRRDLPTYEVTLSPSGKQVIDSHPSR